MPEKVVHFEKDEKRQVQQMIVDEIDTKWFQDKANRVLRMHSSKETQEATSTIIETFMHILFVIMTILKAKNVRSEYIFHLNQGIRRGLFEGKVISNETYRDTSTITNADGYYNFLKNNFLHRLLPGNGSLFLGENVLLGRPILRQIRMRDTPCELDKYFFEYVKKCYPPYSTTDEEKYHLYNNKTYSELFDIGAYPLYGNLGTYTGGGFIEELSLNIGETIEIVDKLIEINWIDEATRLVILETSLFNDNVKLYCNIKVVAEFPAGGGLEMDFTLVSTMIYTSWDHFDWREWCVNICFFICHFYFTILLVKAVAVDGFILYITQLKNIFYVILFTLLWADMTFEFWHIFYVRILQDQFKMEPEKYLRIDTLTTWNEIFCYNLFVCCFIIQVQTIFYLCVHRHIIQFVTCLRNCFMEFRPLAVFLVTFFFAYLLCGCILYGESSTDFHSLQSCFLTLLDLLFGNYNIDDIERKHSITAFFYFYSFILLSAFGLLSLVKCLVYQAYKVSSATIDIQRERKGQVIIDCLRHFLYMVCCFVCIGLSGKKAAVVIEDDDESAGPSRRNSERLSDTHALSRNTSALLRQHLLKQQRLAVEIEEAESTIALLFAKMHVARRRIDNVRSKKT